MSWQIFITISIVFNSFSTLVQRTLMRDQKSDSYTFAIVFQLLGAFFIFIAGLLFGEIAYPDLSGVWINFVFLLILYGFGSVLMFESFKHVEASNFTIVFTSRAIITILASMIFLGEILSLIQLVGICLILFGVIIVSIKNAKGSLTHGIGYVILAAICFGLAVVNDKYIFSEIEIDVFSFLVLGYSMPVLLMLMVRPRSVFKFKVFFSWHSSIRLVIFTLLYVIQSVAYYFAIQDQDISVVASVKQLTTILTVILAILILGERKNIGWKLIGVLVGFVGLIML